MLNLDLVLTNLRYSAWKVQNSVFMLLTFKIFPVKEGGFTKGKSRGIFSIALKLKHPPDLLSVVRPLPQAFPAVALKGE